MALTQITSEGIKDGEVKTADILNANVTTAKLADGSVTGPKLATESVSTVKIGDGQVTEAKLATDAITTGKIADDAVTSALIADNAVVTAAINADAVTGAKIADDAIDSEHYTDGSIDTAHIADNQVTLAKMAGGTDGQIITYDASGDPVAVGPGTDGQVLTSTGAGSPPAFETLPTSGATLTGSTDNTICTVTGANAIQGEANLTFDGSTLKATTSSGLASISIGSGDASGANLVFDGDSNGDFAGNDYSSIQHTSDGNLIIKANSPGTANCYIALGSDGDYGAHFNEGGSSLLRYDNSTKIETITTGINITGGVRLGGNNAANEISDYEEGTWTPAIGFGGDAVGVAYGDSLGGSYVKIGRFVWVHGRIHITDKGSSTGNATIRNLPFTAGNHTSGTSSIEGGAFFTYQMNWMSSLDYHSALAYIPVSTAILELYYRNNSGDITAIDNSDWEDTTSLAFEAFYPV